MAEEKIRVEGRGFMEPDKFLPYGSDMKFFALLDNKIYVKRSNDKYEFLKELKQGGSRRLTDSGRIQ